MSRYLKRKHAPSGKSSHLPKSGNTFTHDTESLETESGDDALTLAFNQKRTSPHDGDSVSQRMTLSMSIPITTPAFSIHNSNSPSNATETVQDNPHALSASNLLHGSSDIQKSIHESIKSKMEYQNHHSLPITAASIPSVQRLVRHQVHHAEPSFPLNTHQSELQADTQSHPHSHSHTHTHAHTHTHSHPHPHSQPQPQLQSQPHSQSPNSSPSLSQARQQSQLQVQPLTQSQSQNKHQIQPRSQSQEHAMHSEAALHGVEPTVLSNAAINAIAQAYYPSNTPKQSSLVDGDSNLLSSSHKVSANISGDEVNHESQEGTAIAPVNADNYSNSRPSHMINQRKPSQEPTYLERMEEANSYAPESFERLIRLITKSKEDIMFQIQSVQDNILVLNQRMTSVEAHIANLQGVAGNDKFADQEKDDELKMRNVALFFKHVCVENPFAEGFNTIIMFGQKECASNRWNVPTSVKQEVGMCFRSWLSSSIYPTPAIAADRKRAYADKKMNRITSQTKLSAGLQFIAYYRQKGPHDEKAKPQEQIKRILEDMETRMPEAIWTSEPQYRESLEDWLKRNLCDYTPEREATYRFYIELMFQSREMSKQDLHLRELWNSILQDVLKGMEKTDNSKHAHSHLHSLRILDPVDGHHIIHTTTNGDR